MRAIFLIILIIFSLFDPLAPQLNAGLEDTQKLLNSVSTITILVPFMVGGKSDSMGRALAMSLSRTLRKNVVVWNFPGKKGTMGWKKAASARPDGLTLTIYNKALPKKANGRPSLEDFKPIAIFAKGYGLLAPKRTPKNIIDYLENATKKAIKRSDFEYALQKIGAKPYFVNSSRFITEINNW